MVVLKDRRARLKVEYHRCGGKFYSIVNNTERKTHYVKDVTHDLYVSVR